ncbi:MAG: helix-turn-helix domain-containing protein [Oscillospiraceae bacterium]
MSIANLSPKALKVLSFLKEKANNKTNSSFWRKSKIAEACKMSARTVIRAINELKANALILAEERYDPSGRQKSNLYTVLENRDTRVLQAPVASKSLSGTQLKVYTYLLMRCGLNAPYRIGKNEIARSCKLHAKTVQRCIAELCRTGYICSVSQSKTAMPDDHSCGYNLYTVLRAIKAKFNYAALIFAAMLNRLFSENSESLLLGTILSPSPGAALSPLRTISKLKINSNERKIYCTQLTEKNYPSAFAGKFCGTCSKSAAASGYLVKCKNVLNSIFRIGNQLRSIFPHS